MKTHLIMNSTRIDIDNLIETHGPENFINEIKSIFREKMNGKVTPEEREIMKAVIGTIETPIDNIRTILETFGAGILMQTILDMFLQMREDLKHDESYSTSNLNQMIRSLQAKQFKKVWGIK